MEANNHQGIQMELAQESLVKELDAAKRRECDAKDMEQAALEHAANWEERVLAAEAEVEASKRREAELRKDNKDLFVAVFRCKATEARVKTLEEREAELQISKAAVLVDLHRANQRIACSSSERDQLTARVKTLEDAIRQTRYWQDPVKINEILEQALAAKEPKA